MYPLLRGIAGFALRWYYRRIDIEGRDRVPRRGPLLLAVNHPNALVDALLVGWSVPRRIVLTAKATLFQNPVLAWLLRRAGVVPLIRASDVQSAGAARSVDPTRNAVAFRALNEVLARGGAILIFPEGISHDEPSLAPLRTGAARIALEARDGAGIRGLTILPIGLVFERKEAPRSRVLVQVGEPIAMDGWRTHDGERAAQALTDEISARLRAVTLNFTSSDDAARATALASLVAALFTEPMPLDAEAPSLREELGTTRRIEDARRLLVTAAPELRTRADELLHRMERFEGALAAHALSIGDLEISTRWREGARFLVREGWIFLAAGPVALWGEINHWFPFHAARFVALRRVESASDPAMRTILAGALFVLLCYAVQGALVARAFGVLAAGGYLLSLPLAAEVMFLWRERLARARRRAKTFLLLRRRPALAARLHEELRWLRGETLEVEAALRDAATPAVGAQRVG